MKDDKIDNLGRNLAMRMIVEAQGNLDTNNLIEVIKKTDLKHCDKDGKSLLFYLFEHSVKLPITALEEFIMGGGDIDTNNDYSTNTGLNVSPGYIFSKKTKTIDYSQKEFEKIFFLLMNKGGTRNLIDNLYLIKKDYLRAASQQFWEGAGVDNIFSLRDMSLSIEIIRNNKFMLFIPIKNQKLFLEKLLIEANPADNGSKGVSFVSMINLEGFISADIGKINYKKYMNPSWLGEKNYQYLLNNKLINNYDVFQSISSDIYNYPEILRTEEEFIKKTGHDINEFKKILLEYGLNVENMSALFSPILKLSNDEIIFLVSDKNTKRMAEGSNWDSWKKYREDPLICYIDYSITNKFIYDDKIVDCLLTNSPFIEIKDGKYIINELQYAEAYNLAIKLAPKKSMTENGYNFFLTNLVDMANIRKIINGSLTEANTKKNKI